MVLQAIMITSSKKQCVKFPFFYFIDPLKKECDECFDDTTGLKLLKQECNFIAEKLKRLSGNLQL